MDLVYSQSQLRWEHDKSANMGSFFWSNLGHDGHQQPGSVYVNLKEVVPALMAGLDGLINYLTFWKSVEWISLLFGIGCFILWVSGKIVTEIVLFWYSYIYISIIATIMVNG